MQERGSLPHSYSIKQYVVYSQQKETMVQGELAVHTEQLLQAVDLPAGVATIGKLETEAATLEESLLLEGSTATDIEALEATAQAAAASYLDGDETSLKVLRQRSEYGEGGARFALLLAMLVVIAALLISCTTLPVEPGVTTEPTQIAEVTEIPVDTIDAPTELPPTPTFEIPATSTIEPVSTKIPEGVIGGDWDELGPLQEYFETCFAETGITGGVPSESIISSPAYLAHFGGESNPFIRFRNLDGTPLDEIGNYLGTGYGPHDALLCGFDQNDEAQYLIFTHPEAATVGGLEINPEDGTLSPSHLEIHWETLDGSDLDIDDIFNPFETPKFGIWWTDASDTVYPLLFDGQRFVYVTEDEYQARKEALSQPEATATVAPTEQPTQEPTAEPTATATAEVLNLPENMLPLKVNQKGEVELFCQLENITASVSELLPGVTQLVTADCLFEVDDTQLTLRVSLMHQTADGVFINTSTGAQFYQRVQATLEDAEGFIASGGLLGLKNGTKVRLSLTSSTAVFHPTNGVQNYFDGWLNTYETAIQQLKNSGSTNGTTLPVYELSIQN